MVSRKRLADFIEALIGAYYSASGHSAAWKILSDLRIIEEVDDQLDLDSVGETILGDNQVQELEKILGYEFQQKGLLSLCFRHTSSSDISYDKLEFLGDAILDFSMMEHFYDIYEDYQPGALATLKSSSVNTEFLGFVCAQLGIHEYLKASNAIKNEIQEYTKDLSDLYERDNEAPKVLADLVEALVGAVYVDSLGDFERTKTVIFNLLGEFIESDITLENVQRCPMRLLNETLQKMRADPKQSISYDFGQDEGIHTCKVLFLGQVISEAVGNSKKTCKRRAARLAVDYLTINNSTQQ